MSHRYPFITVLDAATQILGRPAQTGADFAEAGLEIMGGCQNCGATLAAYNASPSTSGYWKCAGSCIGDDGFHTVSEFLLSIEDLSLADLEYFCENAKLEGSYAEVRAAARRLALAYKAMQHSVEAGELVLEWGQVESKDGACACGFGKPCADALRCAVRGLVDKGVDLTIFVCGDHKRRVVEAQLAVKVCELWAANGDRRAPALFFGEAEGEKAADDSAAAKDILGTDDLWTEDHVHFLQGGQIVLTVNAAGWRWRSHPKENLPRVKVEPDDAMMQRALRAFMDSEQSYPSVWFISEHGNTDEVFVREPLKTETNTPEMCKRIIAAFKDSLHCAEDVEEYQLDFEHGQWWVTHKPTGKQWSVVDAEGGPAIDGFDFELVSKGEEE